MTWSNCSIQQWPKWAGILSHQGWGKSYWEGRTQQMTSGKWGERIWVLLLLVMMNFCNNPGLQLRCPLSLKSVVVMQLDKNMLTTPVSALLQKHPEVSGCKFHLIIEINHWQKWWQWVCCPVWKVLTWKAMVLEQEVVRCWWQKVWKLRRPFSWCGRW